jgi:O-antigen/teichoic acid export membrane protein
MASPDIFGLRPRLPEPLRQDAGAPAGVGARSLRLNFSWTLVGNVVYAGTQWGILVLLARLGSRETVGQFSLGLAITAPIMLFASLQLRVVQATDARGEFQFRDYVGLRMLTTIVAACVIFGVGGTLYRGGMALTIAAFALSKGVESLSDVVYGLWQQQERMDLIAQSLILRGVMALIAVAICFVAFHTVWMAVCAMAVAWAAVFAIFDVPRGVAAARRMHAGLLPRFSAVRMSQLARLSLPLGFVTMLISFSANVPRYVIGHLQSIRELGVFSALGYIPLAGTIIVGALGQSATPRLALYASQTRTREFLGLLCRLLAIGMMLGICGVLAVVAFGRQIVTLIYGPEYAQNQALLIWLMVAAAASYMASFAGNSLTAARHFRVQLPLFGFLAILTLALCYAMAKSGGVVGVAKALSLAGLVQLVTSLGVLWYAEMRKPVAMP